MADQEVAQATTYIWMRNRELSALYEKLLRLGASSECLALIEELMELHRRQRDDCQELLAFVRIEIPGKYDEIQTSDDLNELLPIIWNRENETMDMGWMRTDRLISDETARAVVIRGTGRQYRKLRLLREISVKCNIVIITEPPLYPLPRPVPTPTPTPMPGMQDYVVQPGDTMYLIARRYGVSLDALIRANPQIRNPELIYPGEVIHIPSGRMPQPNDNNMYPGPSTGGARRYVVMEGETIEIIARKFGMNVTELTAFNPQLSPPYTLTTGQVIFIPAPNAVG